METVNHDVEIPFTKIKYTKTFHLLRITRREQVSTTGRWNALKLAVSIAVPRMYLFAVCGILRKSLLAGNQCNVLPLM